MVTDEEEVEGVEEGENKFYDVCKLENEKKWGTTNFLDKTLQRLP